MGKGYTEYGEVTACKQCVMSCISQPLSPSGLQPHPSPTPSFCTSPLWLALAVLLGGAVIQLHFHCCLAVGHSLSVLSYRAQSAGTVRVGTRAGNLTTGVFVHSSGGWVSHVSRWFLKKLSPCLYISIFFVMFPWFPMLFFNLVTSY